MLQFFRNFFKSKLGVVITLVFLALIALAFASSDVANTGTFGGVSGGDRVAVVGDSKISTSELSMNVSNAVEQVRQRDPRVTVQSFIARGGIDEVLDQMLRRAAIAEFARQSGLRAGDRLIDSEILQIPAFRGPDGAFDQNAFLAAIRQRGLTEAAVRDDLAMGLLARQAVTPVAANAQLPQKLAQRYAALLLEERSGEIALLPTALYAPEGAPTDAQLKAFYQSHESDFIRPERRVIRYVTFGEEALARPVEPTEAQVAARFNRDKAQYAAKETRTFTQLVVPNEADARAIAAQAQGGKSLEAAAKEKGLATTTLGPVSQAELTTSASTAVAQAAFSAAKGAIAAPARGGLGWYVLRVDAVNKQPARALADVRGEIRDTLAAEQRRQAVDDLTVRIESELEDGRSLADVAKELKLNPVVSKPLTADGRVYGSGEPAPEQLGPVLNTAFEMDEGEPQLATLGNDSFIIFEASDITPSAVAPLAEIKDDVTLAWRRSQGNIAAKQAADRVMKRVAAGASLAQAMSEEKKRTPPPERISMTRRELTQQGQVPAPLALFFSMASGTVKKLEGRAEGGWYLVKLDKVEPGTVKQDDPIIATTASQLGNVTGDEYAEQFMAAVQAQIGSERNQAAIDAVRAQLVGNAN
ncbi:peptidylprolyl isomerase [Altererythrobacter sp. B11]|uniref:peptidylprolyl isomerase n=1 Tax=Altererythrobacter sp. B11 TaxID=2060312 RepID=UPI000DC6D3C8|nr:peptidylprolyl isomerase [Altererythrobacter sp. B11]BBC73041.1 peptidylprolyl isomerase [Altererythrobacter sp. B11]